MSLLNVIVVDKLILAMPGTRFFALGLQIQIMAYGDVEHRHRVMMAVVKGVRNGYLLGRRGVSLIHKFFRRKITASHYQNNGRYMYWSVGYEKGYHHW